MDSSTSSFDPTVLMTRGKRATASYIHADCYNTPCPKHLNSVLDCILNPQKTIDDWETIDWCKWLVAGGRTPDEFVAIVRAYDNATTCGLVWTPNFVAYRCRTCGISPCMSLCTECFKKGNHQRHDFNMFLSQAGGACDCGDTAVMKETGFCDRHGPDKASHKINAPNDLMCVAEAMMPRIIFRLILHLRENCNRPVRENQKSPIQDADAFITMLLDFNNMGGVMRRVMTFALTNPQKYKVLNELPENCDSESAQCILESKRIYEEALESLQNPDMLEYRNCRSLTKTLTHKSFLEELVFWTVKYEFPQRVVCLVLHMLPDTDYKEALTRAFILHYSRISMMLEISSDTDMLSNRMVHVSVQLFSNERLALKMTNEMNLLHVMVVSLKMMLTKVLKQNTLHDTEKNVHNVVDCGSSVMKGHCYWPLVSDLNNVLSHRPVALKFMADDTVVELWFAFLSVFQGMNVNQREMSTHIEFEPNTYYAAFSAELEASAYPMWALVSHLTDDSTAELTQRILTSCLNELKKFLDDINFQAPNVNNHLQVSFHLPLHRYFSVFLCQAVSKQGITLNNVLPSNDILWLMMMHPLQVQVAFYEILNGLWVRNGLQIKGQAMTYIQCNFCNSMVDADLYLLQISCTRCCPNKFFNTVIDKFHIKEWMSLAPSHIQQNPYLEPEHDTPMLESFLTFLATLVSVRTNIGLSERDLNRLEMLTLLCMGDRTHSQLMELMPERCGTSQSRDFETLLSEVADYRPPAPLESSGTLQQGMYSPSAQVWENLYDPIHVLLRAVHRRDFQISMDRYTEYVRHTNKLKTDISSPWPPFRDPSECADAYEDPRQILNSKVFHAAALVILHKAVRGAVSEHIMALIVFLLNQAVAVSMQKCDNNNKMTKMCTSGPVTQRQLNDMDLETWFTSDSLFENLTTIVNKVILTPEPEVSPINYSSDSDLEWETSDTIDTEIEMTDDINADNNSSVAGGSNSNNGIPSTSTSSNTLMLQDAPPDWIVTGSGNTNSRDNKTSDVMVFGFNDLDLITDDDDDDDDEDDDGTGSTILALPSSTSTDRTTLMMVDDDMTVAVPSDGRVTLVHEDTISGSELALLPSTSGSVAATTTNLMDVDEIMTVAVTSGRDSSIHEDGRHAQIALPPVVQLPALMAGNEVGRTWPACSASTSSSTSTDLVPSTSTGHRSKPYNTYRRRQTTAVENANNASSPPFAKLNESIISLLLKLHSQLSGVPDSYNPDDEDHVEANSSSNSNNLIGDGPFFIAKLLKRMSQADDNCKKCISETRMRLWPSQEEREEAKKQRETREREERRRRAKERQQKLMAEFASKQKQFMERTMETDENAKKPDDEILVSKQEYDCVICSQSTPSTEDQPMGLVVLIQATSVIGHRRQFGQPEQSVLPTCSDDMFLLRRDDTLAAEFDRRVEDLYQLFDPKSINLSVNLGWDGGVHVQTCGHHLHLDCLNSYLRSLRTEQRQLNLSPDEGEYLCPLCRQLANSVLPLVPQLGECAQMVRSRPLTSMSQVLDELNEFLKENDQIPSITNMREAIGNVMEVMSSTTQLKPMFQPRNPDSISQSLFLFITSIARTNLEVELIQRGGTLVTTSLPNKLSNPLLPKRDCIVPLLHVLSVHARIVLRMSPAWMTFQQLWGLPPKSPPLAVVTALAPIGEEEVPLLIRDPIALLLQFVLLLPLHLDQVYFTTTVQMVYNLLYYQVVAQISCGLTGSERSRVAAQKTSTSNNGNDGKIRNFSDALALINECLGQTDLYMEDDGGAGTSSTSNNTNLDVNINALEQQVQKLCLPFLRIAALLKYHIYQQALPEVRTPQNEYIRLVYYLELVTESMDLNCFNAAIALNWPNDTQMMIQSPVSWCEQFRLFVNRSQIAARRFLVDQHITWHPPRLLQLPREYEKIFAYYHERPCSQCHSVPQETSICLLCGTVVCLKQSCCKQQNICEATAHAMECGAGTGVFLVVTSTYIIVIRGLRACLWGSLYLDEFEEEDRDLKRGKPLYLSKDRYQLLEQQWLAHRFDHTKKMWVPHRNAL